MTNRFRAPFETLLLAVILSGLFLATPSKASLADLTDTSNLIFVYDEGGADDVDFDANWSARPHFTDPLSERLASGHYHGTFVASNFLSRPNTTGPPRRSL